MFRYDWAVSKKEEFLAAQALSNAIRGFGRSLYTA